jgi:hypothetical protein
MQYLSLKNSEISRNYCICCTEILSCGQKDQANSVLQQQLEHLQQQQQQQQETYLDGPRSRLTSEVGNEKISGEKERGNEDLADVVKGYTKADESLCSIVEELSENAKLLDVQLKRTAFVVSQERQARDERELARTPDEAERRRLCEEVAGLQKRLQAAESAREREIQEKAEERERMEELAEEALREYHQARNRAPQIEIERGGEEEERDETLTPSKLDQLVSPTLQVCVCVCVCVK